MGWQRGGQDPVRAGPWEKSCEVSQLNHQYYTNSIFNSHIIIRLKTRSFNVKLLQKNVRLHTKTFVYSIQTGVYCSTY